MSRYNRLAEEEDQARTMIGLLLHRSRMHRKVTRAWLARKIGVTAARIREIEKGVGRSAKLTDLEVICNALKMRMQVAAEPAELFDRLIEHPVSTSPLGSESAGKE